MRRPDDREILRYLSYKGITGETEEIRELIRRCRDLLEPVLRPRSCVRFFDVTCEENRLCIGSLKTDSRSLYRNMKGCTQAAVMACTLGIETDRLIQRKQLTSMSESACLDAMASAYIEAWCDEVNERIRTDAAKENLYCRPRFSPGYGDLPLAMQKEIFSLMPVTKETGITLTDSCLMIPSKSVTAIIGMSIENRNCILQGCEECTQSATCAYSRSGE